MIRCLGGILMFWNLRRTHTGVWLGDRGENRVRGMKGGREVAAGSMGTRVM
jgi:hypothetical protein